jgi:hypothetical protein
MRLAKAAFFTLLAIAMTGLATADTKVVQQSHQDSYTIMGQTQPASDTEQVMWIGDDRVRLDQGSTSVLIRVDQEKMYFLDHEDKTSSAVDLPFDIKEYLPQGMGDQIAQMMKFEVEVTPTDETRTIGEWTTKRYDAVMTSQMVTVDSTFWVAHDVHLDFDHFYELYEQMVAAQPGMTDVVTAMRSMKGFVIEQQGVAKMPMMGDVSIGSSLKTVSIEDATPPGGIYDPPADYTAKELDLMAMMQKQQGR